SSRQMNPEGQPVYELTCDQEGPPDVLAPRRAHARDQLRVVEQMADAEGRPPNRVHGIARPIRDDLLREPAGVAADHGLALPHRLRRTEVELGAYRFLEHD